MAVHSVGFIGGGGMASAMIGGILKSRLFQKEQIIASARTKETLLRLSRDYGIATASENPEVAKTSDLVVLAVKPASYPAVIQEIRDFVTEDALIIAIAAGIRHDQLNEMFQKPVKIIRAMPNTPAQVMEGMSALTPNELVSEAELKKAVSVFESFGKAEIVPESLMDAVTGVSGSSPAYVYLFIEAMADAAVADGMPRAQAYKFAAQAVCGAAKMVLETGMHPGELKDAVCSPGGTTIAAVAKLEEAGMRNAVIQAQRCCVARSKELGKL